MSKEKILAIAIVAHQANKAWCETDGDYSQKDWIDADAWQRESAIKGVQFRIDNPDAGPDAQHNSWMKDKLDDGWVYGEMKDAEKKTHHCLVPFDKLPEFQQKKDKLFSSIVDALIEKKSTFAAAGSDAENNIVADKLLRVGLDKQLQNLKILTPSRERALSVTKLQEAIMWLGMDLKRMNEPNPYPNSYKPENTKIEPTADGLKL